MPPDHVAVSVVLCPVVTVVGDAVSEDVSVPLDETLTYIGLDMAVCPAESVTPRQK